MNARPQFAAADPAHDLAVEIKEMHEQYERSLLDMIDSRLRIALEVRTTHRGLAESVTEVRALIAQISGRKGVGLA